MSLSAVVLRAVSVTLFLFGFGGGVEGPLLREFKFLRFLLALGLDVLYNLFVSVIQDARFSADWMRSDMLVSRVFDRHGLQTKCLNSVVSEGCRFAGRILWFRLLRQSFACPKALSLMFGASPLGGGLWF